MKVKKLIIISFVSALLLSSVIISGAHSATVKHDTTEYTISHGGSSSTYETSVRYRAGGWLVTDNPSIVSRAESNLNMYRSVYATVTETSNGNNHTVSEGSYSIVGRGAISVNAWEFGTYGKGYGTAAVRSGTSSTSSLVHECKLTVN